MADNSVMPSPGNAGLPVKTSPVGADILYLVDSQDSSQSPAGTSKSLTIGNLTTNYLSGALQTFTNKTLDTGGVGNVLKINGTQITGVTGTGSAVLASAPTLTAPVIATITNTGTLTLPTSTDTLVGRATTDTLTNKTLTSPVLNVGSDAQGDVYYRNATGQFARLAPGTSGQFLKTQGAAANPVWANAAGFNSGFSVYKAANQSINASTTSKIAFDTKGYDLNTEFDATTNYRFTPVIASGTAYYLFTFTALVQSIADNSTHTMYIYKNGSVLYEQDMPHTTNANASGVITAIIPMVNTDYVEFYINNGDAGSARNMIGGNSGQYAFAMGQRLF